MSDWQPSASIDMLRTRAALYTRLREFFAARQVLEVETPVLSQAAVADPYLVPLQTRVNLPGAAGQPLYLHTSPEYPMKRLLAAGSGSIYQLCRVFRNDESGRRHNPEFTMLEWYRVGFNDADLMDEIEALMQRVFADADLHVARISYADLFKQHLGINPHTARADELAVLAQQQLQIAGVVDTVSDWLNLLFSHLIEPQLVEPTLVFDYPACQAALARLATDADGVTVAKRFELFMQGTELANGYHELTCATEQHQRFEQEQQLRESLGLPRLPTDQNLVAALESGLPDCAGVALGVDRLLMLLTNSDHIDKVLAFPISKA